MEEWRQTKPMSTQGTKEELLAIIEGTALTSVYQPVVNIQHQRLYGYEALTRGPANSTLHNPLTLFDAANRYELMGELEFACSRVACETFAHFRSNGRLFLNISPLSLLERHYRLGMLTQVLDHARLSPENVVIELSEQYPMDDYDALRKATDQCRAEGFSIAIDDLGAGYAGLRTWSELRPQFVKIDRHFVENIHNDQVKKEFVRSIVEIAAELDCQVIAEGIETPEDLHTVQDMGIPYGQGFLLGRPEARPEQDMVVLSRIRSPENTARQRHRSAMRAREMASNPRTATPDSSVEEVCDIFHNNRSMTCLPILSGTRPVGLVDRHDILELLSQQYARSLHGRKPISHFMNTRPIVVDVDTRLEDISRQLTTDPAGRLSQDFLVTHGGDYFGVGSTATLLRRITEQQIRNARYANPLTLLPGNVPLHEQIESLLEEGDSFRIAYFDVNHFKPYNDHYGYSWGDDVIIALSQILIEEAHPERDFVGHVGGDDFVAIMQSEDWEARCHRVLKKFDVACAAFYTPEDFDKGGIWNLDRSGERQFFKLLSLSCGVAHPDPVYCRSLHEVSALAVDAKTQAKRQGGSAVFISRRRRPPEQPLEDQAMAR